MITAPPTRALHVVPRDRGTWTVRTEAHGTVVLSEHASATDAEHAALRQAERTGQPVVVHDRYHRVRAVVGPASEHGS